MSLGHTLVYHSHPEVDLVYFYSLFFSLFLNIFQVIEGTIKIKSSVCPKYWIEIHNQGNKKTQISEGYE